MPTVETSVVVDAPIDLVYSIAKDNASFPEFMKDVKSLTIVENDGRRVVSDWVGIVPQFMLKVRWKQEDLWDDEARTCEFRQLEGDYDKLEGYWKFVQDSDKTRFDSFVEYEYNVPTLGPLVKKIIHNIVIQNMDNVLSAIKQRAESRAN
jgi:uncharacterized membrane protein